MSETSAILYNIHRQNVAYNSKECSLHFKRWTRVSRYFSYYRDFANRCG